MILVLRSTAPDACKMTTSDLGSFMNIWRYSSILILGLSALTWGQNTEATMDSFQLTSTAFIEGATIPTRYSCEGRDSSPPLAWSGVPEGTKSFALTCVDPDAPVGDWIHWIAWNIPAEITSLGEGINPKDQKSFTQGTNSWGRTGYGGPCPPRGHGAHRYYFTLYALDIANLDLSPSVHLPELQKALGGHLLAKASLMGRYERK